jgi:hypothetical protein
MTRKKGTIMSKRVSVVALLLLALVVTGCREPGQEATASRSGAAEPGFVKLFNGKDLTGWETSGDALWSVQGGLLVGTQGRDYAPGDLFTKESFGDFAAIVTYRVEWPCNSGVWFRFQSPEKAYQADILEYQNPEAYSGTLYCPGKLFLAINTDKTLVDRDGWNTIKIQAERDHLQLWLNGRQVADVYDRTSDSGKIGFQVHPGTEFGQMKIVVRDVQVKKL